MRLPIQAMIKLARNEIGAERGSKLYVANDELGNTIGTFGARISDAGAIRNEAEAVRVKAISSARSRCVERSHLKGTMSR